MQIDVEGKGQFIHLIIVLRLNPTKHSLVLIAALGHLVLVALHSRTHPVTSSDAISRSVLRRITFSLEQRTLQRFELEIVGRTKEVQQPKTIDVRLICRRRDHAVNAGF